MKVKLSKETSGRVSYGLVNTSLNFADCYLFLLTSTAITGLVWFGVVWFGVVWCGVVWFGLVWFGLVWFGLVWFGVVWFGLVCFFFGLVWFGFCKENVEEVMVFFLPGSLRR